MIENRGGVKKNTLYINYLYKYICKYIRRYFYSIYANIERFAVNEDSRKKTFSDAVFPVEDGHTEGLYVRK